MTLIGENLHIISPKVKEAIIQKDENFILDLVKAQTSCGIKTIDLNVGPAKGQLQGALPYLVDLIQKNFDINFSLDTTNLKEMEKGFCTIKNRTNCFLNSVNADCEKAQAGFEMAADFNCNIIALTMNPKGIPSSADERLELAFEIMDYANEFCINNSKIYFDPLILPLGVKQSQALVALETIRMIKESLDDVKTIVGLSNISNGMAKEQRPLVNRVFFALAKGYGLDSAIIDGTDKDLISLSEQIEGKKGNCNPLYLDLYDMAQTFGDLRDIKYNKDDIEQKNIYLTAQILLNKEIYSPSYLERK